MPLCRDREMAKTYRVQPVVRRQVRSDRHAHQSEPFAPEPAITDEDFGYIIKDIATTTRTFERLAVTFADMHEERLRDQILSALHSIYGSATAETFSKRGKTDIYLPWSEGGPVFIAECKWWTGPKSFAEHGLHPTGGSLHRLARYPRRHGAVHPQQERHRHYRLSREDHSHPPSLSP